MPSSPGLSLPFRVVGPLTALATALGAAACARDGGVPDSELGDLVVARHAKDRPIDPAAAARDVDELGRAVATPHSKLAAALGPHRLAIKSRIEVFEPAAPARPAEDLSDETILEYTSDDAWRGVSNNSADYGREVLYLAPSLYLRARYQRWHQRPPTDDREVASLRDRFAEVGPAMWDLLAPRIVVSDRGEVTVAGRAARAIAIATAAAQRRPAAEPLAQRKWREARAVESVEGSATLDVATGAVLALSLRGSVAFQRQGRSFSMKISVDSKLSDFGAAVALAAPPAAEVVATPGRLQEVQERDRLLEGIAPPLRQGPKRSKPTASAP